MFKDKLIQKLINQEIKRQEMTINLIPSENYASLEVLKVLGSPLTNKYSEGYPGKRYYAGNVYIDEIEELAKKRALKLFGLNSGKWGVNVQPYSGSPANMAVYYALLSPGDRILGMSLPHGGHLSHGWKVNFSARFYKSFQYGVGRDGLIDYKDLRKLARKVKPKIIVAGATAYPRKFDFQKFSRIAKEVNAYLLADISHIAGLVAAGVHPSPFPYADVITTTTHKTLRGPRGALIFTNRQSSVAQKNKIDIAATVDKAVFPALQGGPHNHQTAAIAVALEEANQPAFKKYAQQIVKNANVLAKELQNYGFKLVSGGTDNHLLLVDLINKNISGKEAQNLLEQAGIIVNKNMIPYDSRSPFDPSGIRLGTPAITTRGMKEKEMKKISELIYHLLIKKEDLKLIKKEVESLCKKFPLPYKYL